MGRNASDSAECCTHEGADAADADADDGLDSVGGLIRRRRISSAEPARGAMKQMGPSKIETIRMVVQKEM
jgi:hypothetical protein